jgi:hypothetical protein
MKKKYTVIITYEDERYGTDGFGLTYWMENPWDGLLMRVGTGDTCDELFKPEDEGFFFQLYDNANGKRITYGMVDDTIDEEVEEYEEYKKVRMGD